MAPFRRPQPKLGTSRQPARMTGFETLEVRDQPAAGLLADLNATGKAAFSPFPTVPASGATVGQTVYFAATNGTSNPALYKSDGTAAGTTVVADLTGDANAPVPPYLSPTPVLAVGGKLFFARQDAATGSEPWVSDGTAAGTRRLADLIPGAGGSNTRFLAEVNGRAVFRADAPGGEPGFSYPIPALYATDGTAAGTVLLSSAPGIGYAEPIATGGKVYFATLTYAEQSYEATSTIWETDGTAAGTKTFVTLPAGAALDSYSSGGTWATAAGGKLLFAANTSAAGPELWVSDGTAAGTKQLADLNPLTDGPFYPEGPTYGRGSAPRDFTLVGSAVYFTADDGTAGREVWKTDGTAAGTTMVKDLSPTVGSPSSPTYGTPSGSDPTGLTAFGGKLYFAADDGTTNQQFYVTDGTAAGTKRLTTAGAVTSPAGGEWWVQPPAVVAPVGGKLLFALSDAINGRQLWTTDGTAASTAMVTTVGTAQTSAQQWGSGPIPLGLTGGKLLFSADDGVNGRQLWRTDGTAAGTAMVSRLNPTTDGSNPTSFVAVGGRGLFVASDGPGQFGVYATDGTSAPVALAEFNTTADDQLAPGPLTVSGGKAYFVAQYGLVGRELWVTDGTAAGTRKVKAVAQPTGDYSNMSPSGVGNPTDVGGTLYFTIDLPGTGQELWTTDGTDAGTKKVKLVNAKSSVEGPTYDTWPSTPAPAPMRQLTAVGGKLFFAADDGFVGEELWVSDGTEAGTTLVKDIRPAITGGYYGVWPGPADLTAFNGKLYFTAYDGVNGRQLWVSDGTAAGTKLAATVNSETGSDFQAPSYSPYQVTPSRNIVAAGGKLFLPGYDATNGWQLWTSNGTQAGTNRLTTQPAVPPYMGMTIAGLTAVGSKVYFSANDEGGRELWVSDGTTAGTKKVKQIGPAATPDNPYPAGSQPQIVSVVGDKVLFTADDGATGRELWVTDGTAAGTKLAKDFAAGRPSGLPGDPIYPPAPTAAVVGDKLLLAVTDALTGSEPWTVSLADLGVGSPPPVTPPAAGTTTVATAAFNGPKAGTFDRLTVRFSGPVDAATVSKSTVTVSGPNGAVGVSAVLPVSGSNGSAFTLVLSKNQTAAGTYTAVIGPGVKNAAGQAVSPYTATAALGPTTTVPPTVPPASPPVASNGVRVTDAAFGGPKAGTFDRLTVRFSRPVDRSTVGANTVRVTGPNGVVRVSAVLPVAGSMNAVYTLLFSANQTAAGVYTATVGPGVIDPLGIGMDQNANGTNGEPNDTFTVSTTLGTPTTVPPASPPPPATTSVVRATEATFSGPRAGVFDRLTVRFSGPVDAATVSGSTVAVAGPGGAVRVSSVIPVAGSNGTAFTLVFSANQSATGAYTASVGPGVKDAAGAAVAAYTATTTLGTPTVPPTPPPATVTAGVVRVFDVAATEKVAWSGNLASVTLPSGPDYKVTVFWGDGRTATGALARNTPTGSVYTVSAGHTYDKPGSYPVMVRVTGTGGKTVLSIDATATVKKKV
jgi:ELWxxDGT repeat protein